MSFCSIGIKRNNTPSEKEGVIVYNKQNKVSELYPKIVDYTSSNNVYSGRESFFDTLISQGKILDKSPQELALGLYSIAYHSGKSESYWMNKVNQLYPVKETLYQKQTMSDEGKLASEKTIRDLAARISDRIGIPVKFISDRKQEFKGKMETSPGFDIKRGEFDNLTYAVVNLAYATLDTPIHEILGHPIIRAIKTGGYTIESVPNGKWEIFKNGKTIDSSNLFNTREDAANHIKNTISVLYQNLLKELETGTGKQVLDRIKRDYQYKEDTRPNNLPEVNKYGLPLDVFISTLVDHGYSTQAAVEEINNIYTQIDGEYLHFNYQPYEPEFPGDEAPPIISSYDEVIKALNISTGEKYTLEEQQEEAIVELLGLMTADKLDNVKDGKLISLLKRLLKEMKVFLRSLLSQREVEIDKLPDSMTLDDLANLLAYSNSKLILPGYEVKYTTPDNQQFKTYAEASKYIGNLTRSIEEVDLSNVSLKLPSTNIKTAKDIPVNSFTNEYDGSAYYRDEKTGQWYELVHDFDGEEVATFETKVSDEKIAKIYYNVLTNNKSLAVVDLQEFIDKNKEYEQSKEIIEEWKKVNDIQYNPEEVYSRGQEFVSVVGAYSSFDVNLMMQNLLSHIEDNEKAGGQFAISAFTKPVDKLIGHLEGGGGKIKFKMYPKSKDILWATPMDAYSGSVWDASLKINKDKKSELLGVSYTKYPALRNINKVSPNLVGIIDDLADHHNELGIVLTGNNFRLEYDDDIPYQTKKIIDSINGVLDHKYGKVVKPKININNNVKYEIEGYSKQKFDSKEKAESVLKDLKNTEYGYKYGNIFISPTGIQPTQTKDNLKESIESVKKKLNNLTPEQLKELNDKVENGEITDEEEYNAYIFDNLDKINKKEYTSQALINTKIAALKEVAKKYPRSLIRSEVIPTNSVSAMFGTNDDPDLPFQKIPSKVSTSSNTIRDYFQQRFIRSASDLLDDISESSHPLSEVAKTLLPYTKINNVQVHLDLKNVYRKRDIPNMNIDTSAGFYDMLNNEIRIAAFSWNAKNRPEVLIIHEILHALTANELEKNTLTTKEFKRLYNLSVKALGKSHYANFNVHEFMVALFTDSAFIKELQQIPSTGESYKNMFEELLDYILGLFNMGKESSLYSEAFAVASQILQEANEMVNEDIYDVFSSDITYEDLMETKNNSNFIDSLIRDKDFNAESNEMNLSDLEMNLGYLNEEELSYASDLVTNGDFLIKCDL